MYNKTGTQKKALIRLLIRYVCVHGIEKFILLTNFISEEPVIFFKILTNNLFSCVNIAIIIDYILFKRRLVGGILMYATSLINISNKI